MDAPARGCTVSGVTTPMTPEDLICGALLDPSRGPLTPEWEVVRAVAQGRVLHFNGGSCYIQNTDGTLAVAEVGTRPSTWRAYSAHDDFATQYLRSNRAREASLLEALRLAEHYGLLDGLLGH